MDERHLDLQQEEATNSADDGKDVTRVAASEQADSAPTAVECAPEALPVEAMQEGSAPIQEARQEAMQEADGSAPIQEARQEDVTRVAASEQADSAPTAVECAPEALPVEAMQEGSAPIQEARQEAMQEADGSAPIQEARQEEVTRVAASEQADSAQTAVECATQAVPVEASEKEAYMKRLLEGQSLGAELAKEARTVTFQEKKALPAMQEGSAPIQEARQEAMQEADGSAPIQEARQEAVQEAERSAPGEEETQKSKKQEADVQTLPKAKSRKWSPGFKSKDEQETFKKPATRTLERDSDHLENTDNVLDRRMRKSEATRLTVRAKDVKDRYKNPKGRIQQEIKRFQNNTQLLIPRAAFARVVKDVMSKLGADVTAGYKFSPEALEALQVGVEYYFTGVYASLAVMSAHQKRVTIYARDWALLRNIRNSRFLDIEPEPQ